MTEETTPTVHSAPFLSRIILRNFKSVVGQDVSLAPLTLIIGENSSGKSTLFQAVRLMQQAARLKTPGDSFPLNGDSISVGNIEDIRSVQAEDEEYVSIGLEIYTPSSNDDYRDHILANCNRDKCRFCDDYIWIGEWMMRGENGFVIRWQVDLGDEQSGFTPLKRTHFSLTDIHEDGGILNIECVRQSGNMETFGTIDYGNKLEIDFPNPIQVHDIELSGTLPARSNKNCIEWFLLEEKIRTGKEEHDMSYLPELIEDKEQEYAVIEKLMMVLNDSLYVHELCDDDVKYLGPLRETPDRITPAKAALGQTGDIGQSGEFTASVLQRFRRKRILAPTPCGELSHMSLLKAVQEWGRHLGLLQTIRAVQEAKLGNTIKVKSEELNKEVPLDAVGVDVSRLLPVLVLCLLSEPGSMILLEQPELHLRPALQQRLADFLIAAVRSGRQLIVETHSEYIVSRLRRRIAEDTSGEDALLSMSKIVLAERDSQTGVTTYRET